MSIITETLDRVQMERATGAQGDEEGGEIQKPHGSSHRHVLKESNHAGTAGWNLGYMAVIFFALSGLALGTYWWGLTLVPDIPQFGHGGQPSKVLPELQSIDESMPPLERASDGRESLDLPSAPPDAPKEISPSPLKKEPRELPLTIGEKPKESKVKKKAGQLVVLSHPAPFLPKQEEKTKGLVEDLGHQRQNNVKTTVPASAGPSPRIPSLSLKKRLDHVQTLVAQQKYRKASELLQPLFAGPPKRWEPWFWLGTAQLGMDELEAAEHSFREGLARDSTIPHLWIQQALVAQQRGHFNEAINSLRQAEMLAPNLPEIALNLAYSLEWQGKTRHADHYYRKFLSVTEGRVRYHAARLKALARLTHKDGRKQKR